MRIQFCSRAARAQGPCHGVLRSPVGRNGLKARRSCVRRFSYYTAYFGNVNRIRDFLALFPCPAGREIFKKKKK
jgi:hypothetical protein